MTKYLSAKLMASVALAFVFIVNIVNHLLSHACSRAAFMSQCTTVTHETGNLAVNPESCLDSSHDFFHNLINLK